MLFYADLELPFKASSAARSRETANSEPLRDRQLLESTIHNIDALSANVKTMKSILDEYDTAIASNQA